MKKLFALLLSLVMALSLAVPAFAAPAPEEATVPAGITLIPVDGMQEAVPISELLDGPSPDELVSIGIIGGADGPTAIIPGGTADLDAFKTALGGVPGQIGVLVNGAYVKFPDAAPEVTGGRTMVPVRPIVEALGGQARMEDGKVICEADGVRLTLTPGVSEVLTEYTGGELPGDGQLFPMDCAPYIKGGRTYVPVRFLGEILGYEVGWDGGFQTAVLLDQDALAAEIDKDFTILNKVQANQGVAMEEGKNYQADVKGRLTVTAFDTINGNKTYTADLTAKQIFNTEAASAQVSLKLSDNVKEDLVKLLISANAPEGDTAAVNEQVGLLLDGLEDMELILTRKGLGWFRMASLDELAGADNVWLGLDLGAELGGMAFAQTGEATIGSALTAVLDKNSVISVAALDYTVEMMAVLYGDDTFTTSGGVSTRTISVDDLMALYEDMGLEAGDLEEAKAAFKEYQITMKVDGKGKVDVSCNLETAAQAGVPAIKLTMDAKQDAGNVTMNMSLHVANLCEGKLTLTQTWGATTQTPEDQPPEGSTVVDAGALLNP